MARALLLPGNNPTLKTHSRLSFQSGKFTYLVETRDGRSTYTVTDGARTLSLPVPWTFGIDAQTFVLARDGSYIESMVSYYPATGGLDITVGDEALNPQTVEEAIGRPLEMPVVTSCFGCHSTHSATGGKLTLQSLTPGVTCERCHTDAAPHLSAMRRGGHGADVKATMPARIGSRSAEGISGFCGQCHRTWETVVRNNWRGPMNVRFQPYRLANSKCFDGTDARISCLACHNPHQDLVREASSYDVKCLACHGSEAKACPISQTGCVTCHMPKTRLPGGHQIFTDHQIRVVKPGESYPN